MNASRVRYLLRRYGLLWLGLAIVCLMSLAAILAPWLSAHDPLQLNLDAILVPPGAEHLFGTDTLGRDVFARLLFGGRFSLGSAALALAVALLIGAISGLIAGMLVWAITSTSH